MAVINTGIIKVLIGLVVCVSMLFLGFNVGYKKGLHKYEAYIAYIAADDNAVELHNRIKVLTYIKHGENERVVELLENLVDLDVVSLDMEPSYTVYPPSTRKRMISAIKDAKKYRENYPEHKPREKVSKQVEEVFGQVD